MKRTHLNALIDAVAFLLIMTLLSTGLLLRYQLPPGSGGLTGAGTGRGTAARQVDLVWGWTRHEWGDFHFWIAFVLMAVMALHLVLHWKWIVNVVRGTRSDASGLRCAAGAVSLAAVVLLASLPLAATTDQTTREQLQIERGISVDDDREAVAAGRPTVPPAPGRGRDSAANVSGQVRGSMTLGEVAATGGVSVEELAERLGLPADVASDERVAPLLRRHGLRMSDLRRALTATADDDNETEP